MRTVKVTYCVSLSPLYDCVVTPSAVVSGNLPEGGCVGVLKDGAQGAPGWKGPHPHLRARFREHGMLRIVETVLLGSSQLWPDQSYAGRKCMRSAMGGDQQDRMKTIGVGLYLRECAGRGSALVIFPLVAQQNC